MKSAPDGYLLAMKTRGIRTSLLGLLTLMTAALGAAALAGFGVFGARGLPGSARWWLGLGAVGESLVLLHMWRRLAIERKLGEECERHSS